MGLFSRTRGSSGGSAVRLPANFAQILDQMDRWLETRGRTEAW